MRTSSSVGAIINSNNLFTGNVATEDGGGIYCGSTADGLSSCTFRGNQAGGRGGGIYCYETNIRNCIVGENSAPEGPAIYMSDGSYLSIYFSNVDRDQVAGAGTLYWREGNITANPLFVFGPLGAFYLSQFAAGQHEQSPCVDAGDPQGELVDGTTRTDIVPDEGIPDMGFHYPLETAAAEALIVTGPGPGYGNPPRIRVFPAEQDAGYIYEFTAYGIGHYGALVATGELDGDFGSEIVTGAGPGEVFGAHVRGFEIDGTPLPGLSFLAYATRRFGVNVAAGDLTGDGNDEIVTGPGPGAVFGPHVRAFDYDGAAVAPVPGVSFFAYAVPQWGANVACGDIDGDGYDEIVTGPGPGAVYGPHVRGWNVDGGPAVPFPGVSFLAYNTASFGAVVACGDVDGDGIDEIVTGPGPGASFGSLVRGWNTDGGGVTSIPGINFFAWPPVEYRYGVKISAGADLNGDGRAEIVAGPGPDPSAGTPLRVFTFNGTTTALWLSNEAYPPEWTHGTNVASGWF
jgi:predicted outer membrane repeat protein